MKSLGELFQSTYALLFPFHTLTLSSVSTKCSMKTGIYFFFVVVDWDIPRILPGTYWLLTIPGARHLERH